MSSSLQEKASLIRLLILDVDGTLTDGRLYYGNDNSVLQAFHIHDGLGILLLQKAGIPVAIISGKNLPGTVTRMKELHIQHHYLGYSDKLPAYLDLKNKLQLNDEEIAYMGDDLPDLPLMRRVGLAITVPKAPALLQDEADLITRKKAGKGAVREVAETILLAKNLYHTVIQSYLTA